MITPRPGDRVYTEGSTQWCEPKGECPWCVETGRHRHLLGSRGKPSVMKQSWDGKSWGRTERMITAFSGRPKP